MTKKIIISMLILVMCVALLSGCANDYIYKEGDFSLVITADKTEVSVGDTIKVTASLKNLSGRNIRIQMRHPNFRKLEDMILIELFPEDMEHNIAINDLGGLRRKMTIKKGAVITKTREFHIDELQIYDALSLAVFYTGRDYSEMVSIYSEPLKVIIT